METACHQRSATADAFSAFLLPHLLFVSEFTQRRTAAAMCWLAWNISHLYDCERREREIERACKLLQSRAKVTDGDATGEPIIQTQLRELVACKQNLFPHIVGTITQVRLEMQDGADILHVQSNAIADMIEMVTEPDLSTIADTIAALTYINGMTAWQRGQLQQFRYERVLDDIQATRRASAYFLQRADLIAYRAILTAWRDCAPDAETKLSLRYWLETLDDIRANTEAVLSTLAGQEIRDINLIEP